MHDRIKKLRKALDLTQREFGERIGVKPNTIATYEIGRNQPIDAVISLICREFNASETWLRTGEGEMFNAKSSAAMEALARERGLTHSDLVLIEKFLSMKQESRLAVAEYMLEVAAALNSDTTPLDIVTTRKNTDIDTEVGYYRSDLLMDKRLSAADAGQQQEEGAPPLELKPVAEMTHAEIDRFSEQLRQELHREKAAAVKSPASSGSGTNGNGPPIAAGSSGADSATG